MLIGAQQVWAYFPKKKFAKVCALAVSFPRTSGGAKEWQTGSRFRSLQSLGRGRLVRRLRRSAQPRPQKLPPPRSGLPWEHRQERGFFNAFVETLVMVLTKPGEAFAVMKREGGLGEPLIYALIGGCLGGIVSLLFSMGLQSVGFFADRHDMFGAMAGMGAGSAAFIVLIPLFVVIGLFIGSAIVHLCLMIVGGANQSFETTFRVLAFSQGSTGPLQMIPVCGGLISGVWALVCSCIGLARAHDTDTGRAVLAVFLPLIVCCGGLMLILFMLFGLGAWGASHH